MALPVMTVDGGMRAVCVCVCVCGMVGLMERVCVLMSVCLPGIGTH